MNKSYKFLRMLTDSLSCVQGSSPLVCLPPISGTADLFFRQCLALAVRGYRVIAVQWPPYWTHQLWCLGFTHLLDQLGLERVHIFGAALGGFLGILMTTSTSLTINLPCYQGRSMRRAREAVLVSPASCSATHSRTPQSSDTTTRPPLCGSCPPSLSRGWSCLASRSGAWTRR